VPGVNPSLRALFELLDERSAESQRLSEGLTRIAQATTTRGLEELMRTPARRLVLEGLFRELGRRLDGKGSRAKPASVRCTVTGPTEHSDVYELHFRDARCRVVRGATDRRPELRVTLDERELIRLATGRSTPAQALFSGRVKVGGDVAALAALFLSARESSGRA
jgi:alkyl sulfatase BDS1-like metallo-beta-lactamase superfamily hydrolase